MSNLKVIATYPRSMSAWLANFLTIPNHSMYVHDALAFPKMIEHIKNEDYKYKGIVAPAARQDMIPVGAEIIVVDNDIENVRESLINWLGSNPEKTLSKTYVNIERLKEEATTVYDIRFLDEWIDELFEYCTGLDFDERYFETSLQFYVEGIIARQGGQTIRKALELLDNSE